MVKLEIKKIAKNKDITEFDFFIDGVPLAKKLGIERLYKETYVNFTLNFNNQTPYKKYNHLEHYVEIFLGKQEPENQFGSNRVVVYRCDCGCDYCGVTSFRLKVLKNKILWQNIRFEADEDEKEDEPYAYDYLVDKIDELASNRTEYELQFKKFLKKYLVLSRQGCEPSEA